MSSGRRDREHQQRQQRQQQQPQQQQGDIADLQDNFFKQQKKISALKELVRKTEVAHGKSTSSAQEKVKNIAQRLTQLKSKVRLRQSQETLAQDAAPLAVEETLPSLPDEPKRTGINLNPQLTLPSPSASNSSTPNPTPMKPQQRSDASTSVATTSATPGSEKILLLRQQMEQNRVLMAQRASSKLHLEQLVTQLKEKFDSTQQSLEDTTELGKSMIDLSVLNQTPVTRDRHKSATDLSTQPFSLERERIKFLENRCRLLEKQLDKERQGNSRREASLNEETTTSQLSLKRIKELENKVLEFEEALQDKQKVIEQKISRVNELTMEVERLRQANSEQESAVLAVEHDPVTALDHTEELEQLRGDCSKHLQRIAELEEVNDLLETTRSDLTMKNNEMEELLHQIEADLQESKEKLHHSEEELEKTEAKCASLQDVLEKLQNSTQAVVVEAPRDTDSQVKAEMAKQIQELQNEVDELRQETSQLSLSLSEKEKLEISDASIADKITALEATIESQREDLQARLESVQKLEEDLMGKTIEFDVLNANFKVLEEKLQGSNKNKPLFSTNEADVAEHPELQTEIKELKQKLDESNKAMIKLKLKCKQSEKQMEKLKKSSDLHAEIVRLGKVNEELQQKLTELEDEKGQWQLTQVNEDKSPHVADEVLRELENRCQMQLETIRLLEEQKHDQLEKEETTRQELEALQQSVALQKSDERSARVKTEMSEIHLEEQLEEKCRQIQQLEVQLASAENDVVQYKKNLEELQEQKQAVDKKLDGYVTENMELLDKMDKLSKSSSSAESIEIVERLTQQERAEMDEFNKRLEGEEHSTEPQAVRSVHELTQTEMGSELSESLVKLREESSELMSKIELFTTERREVLEKMEHLTTENNALLVKIDELMQQKEQFEANALVVEVAKSKLETKLQEVTKEKELLASQVAESTAQRTRLSQELTSLQQSSEVVATLDSRDGATLFDKCEKSLSKLNSELESYRKANDKNAKFNASKKLAKEAKNAYTQLSELLLKVKEASTAVETVTVVETVVAVTAPNGKALAEYEELTAQNRQLQAKVEALLRELQDIRDTMDEPSVGVQITELPAIVEPEHAASADKLSEALAKIQEYEEQLERLQSTVENLRTQLLESQQANEERTSEASRLTAELESLQKLSADFDRLMSDKQLSYDKQIEQLTRLLRQLEGKCETYEGEMEILQTLVAEQKQQLIEAYKESEHELNMKLLELQERDQQITQLRADLAALRETSQNVGTEVAEDIRKECEKLRESMRINKALVADQVDELSNKQETIDTLNQQIIDLYKTMEENTNKVIEKEDEIAYLQEILDTNKGEVDRLQKDNDEQKKVVDKLLSELHTHQASTQHLPQLETNLRVLEAANKELEGVKVELQHRNKEQLDKLKKYAANLKKRTAHCLELEAKVKELEKGAAEALQSKELSNSDNDQQLSELQATNVALNERVVELEQNLRDTEASTKEIREALQLKTSEWLEGKERVVQLELELKQCQEDLEQKRQEVIQLQNALSASQEQMSDWGDFTADKTTDDDLTLELAEKTTQIAQLQAQLLAAEGAMSLKAAEIETLQSNVKRAQEQMSVMSDDNMARFEALRKELAEKTLSLEIAESALSDVQSELEQIQETEKERQQAVREMQFELQSRKEQIAKLESQLSQTAQQQGDVQELQQQMLAQEQRLHELTDELKAKSLKFEKSKAVIKERNNQIHRLQAQLKDLQDKLSAQSEEEPLQSAILQMQLDAAASASALLASVPREQHEELKQAYEKLNEKYTTEKSNFLETIVRLETLHDGIHDKLQEDMSYMDVLETENNKFREKICKLEECVATFEERRSSMERRANLLDAQLQTRTNEYEKSEDELIYRLNMLADHDDVIGQRLLSSQEEKEHLQERIEQLQSELSNLNAQHSKLEKDYQAYRENAESNLKEEANGLREQLAASVAELQHIQATYDAKLAAKTTEIDELECDLSDQLDRMNTEKRTLTEDLERSRDECSELKDEVVRLKESYNALEQAKHELDRETTWLRMQTDSLQQDQYELQELRMQNMQDKTEIDNLRVQIDTLATNHDIELQALRTQISELDSLRMQVGQNQTDDQVFIETENKRLTDLLAEKEVVIENYQRQNLQLQMAAVTATQASTQPSNVPADVFAATFGQAAQNSAATAAPSGTEGQTHLEADLAEKTELAARLQRDLHALQAEFQSVLEGNTEMQRQIMEKNRELESLRAPVSRAPPTVSSASTHAANEAMPVPTMFFATDQMVPSPFDEIVQVRVNESSLEGVAMSRNDAVPELPTIEDLQRNVSDLEKHAQDLENKLAARNQRETENEDRMRDLQTRFLDNDNRLRERDLLLQAAQEKLQQLEQATATERQTRQTTQQQLEVLQAKLKDVEQELHARTEQLRILELDNQTKAVQQSEALQKYEHNDLDSANRLKELEGSVCALQALVEKRDCELVQLKCALEEEQSLHKRVASLETQIIAQPAVEEQRPTLDMFFGGSAAAPEFESFSIPPISSEPVVEEVIVPKKMYICHPQDAPAHSTEISGLDLVDDWGDTWGGNETAAEATHVANTTATIAEVRRSLVSREQQLEIQLEDQGERLKELELLLERSEQQKQEVQVKSGKLMKKLKEYKTKIDELQTSAAAAAAAGPFRKSVSVESNSMFADLDATIQEELKTQIKKLEEKLEEQLKASENFNLEKEKLLKRIDVLTAGNERMSEMKERQDMDVHMYQVRIQELQDKLNKLDDWGAESSVQEEQVVPHTATNTEVTAAASGGQVSEVSAQLQTANQNLETRIAELIAENQDLSNDRHELQALLEDEKANATRAEELVRSVQQQMESLSASANSKESAEKSKYNDLMLQFQNLQTSYGELQEANLKLAAELSTLKECESKWKELQTAFEQSEADGSALQADLLELRTRHQELLQANEELRAASSNGARNEVDMQQLQKVTEDNAQFKARIEALLSQIASLEDRASQAQAVSTVVRSDELEAQLHEKEAEIEHLKQRIEDLMREDQTEKLVLEILTKNQEIHMLKMTVKNLEEDKHELENNLSLQITKEMQADKDDVEKVQNGRFVEQIASLQGQVKELADEKRQMEEELQVLNNHVLSSLEMEDKMKSTVLELDMKNIEIAELRKSLDAVKSNMDGGSAGASTDPAAHVAALNAQWETVVEQKCGEIAQMWRAHLEQREREFKVLEAHLQEEITLLKSGHTTPAVQQQAASAETTATSTTVSESVSESGSSYIGASKEGTPLRARIRDEESEVNADAIIEKMQSALESQEMEIVTLKEQLAIRSAEYARLAAQYDPFKLQTTLSHSGVSAAAHTDASSPTKRTTPTGENAALVPKSELDLAMYMLHQRDMRCDEMTLELVSLLEERDTLQLKLSNALRQVEGIKAHSSYVESAPAGQTDATGLSAAGDMLAGQIADDSADELNQKLSQLQTVNHSKDKVFKEERDQRIRQMEKLQQDVAKMPPAAVSELVGADFAQSNQSPSAVILNWLWGNAPNSGNGNGRPQ